jgi:hypothetical protein
MASICNGCGIKLNLFDQFKIKNNLYCYSCGSKLLKCEKCEKEIKMDSYRNTPDAILCADCYNFREEKEREEVNNDIYNENNDGFPSYSDYYLNVWEICKKLIFDGYNEAEQIVLNIETYLENKNKSQQQLLRETIDAITKLKANLKENDKVKYESKLQTIINVDTNQIDNELANKKLDGKIIFTNLIITAILFCLFMIISNRLSFIAISFLFGYYAYWGIKRKRFPMQGFLVTDIAAILISIICILLSIITFLIGVNILHKH